MVQADQDRAGAVAQNGFEPFALRGFDGGAAVRSVAVEADDEPVGAGMCKIRLARRAGETIRKGGTKRLQVIMIARQRQKRHVEPVEHRAHKTVIAGAAIEHVAGEEYGIRAGAHAVDHRDSRCQRFAGIVPGIAAVRAQMQITQLHDDHEPPLSSFPIRKKPRLRQDMGALS